MSVLGKENVERLFAGMCTLVFTYEDGSQCKVITTLNPQLLNHHGYNSIDGIVDFDLGRPVPVDEFSYLTEIHSGVSYTLSPLDEFIHKGGKALW